MIKKIFAVAAAIVLAASLSVSAFATTYEDAVQAAKEAGVQSNNVQELEYFLQEHKDCFTSEEYDDMIADLNNIRDTYVLPYCKGGAKEKVANAPADLTEREKLLILDEWTEDEKKAIMDDLINLAKKLNVTVTITKVDDQHVAVTAEHRHVDSPSVGSDGSVASVGRTGNAGETETSNAAVVIAAAAVILAAAGLVVFLVVKKKRACHTNQEPRQ